MNASNGFKMPSDDELVEAIEAAVQARGVDKTVCPSEIARDLAGSNEKDWRRLMKPIRAVAVSLAGKGRIAIRRKGKPVDPENFKGIYRLGPPDGHRRKET